MLSMKNLTVVANRVVLAASLDRAVVAVVKFVRTQSAECAVYGSGAFLRHLGHALGGYAMHMYRMQPAPATAPLAQTATRRHQRDGARLDWRINSSSRCSVKRG